MAPAIGVVEVFLMRKIMLDIAPKFIDTTQEVISVARISFCHFVDVSSKHIQNQINKN